MMSLEPVEQFRSFLERSKEVLILIPENPSGDAVGSAWALYFFLEKKNIRPTIAYTNGPSNKFSFLPQPERILHDLSGSRDFVLQFDTSRNKVSNLRTEENEGKFTIYLTPEKGSIDPRDFSFILAKFQYDLIVAIGSPDLAKIGRLYEKNTDLFFEVPIVNIDYRSDNENFGQINLVDIVASSSSEIMSNILESIDFSAINKKIAECLLAGLIAATDSFQKKNTTPRALLAAANLIDKGADQQEIIRWLYKTHPLHILKLWGRAMSKINWDEKSKIVWSDLSLDDFIQSRASAEDVPLILEKLQENYSEGRIFMLSHNDTPSSSVILVKTSAPEILQHLHLHFDGQLKKDLLKIKMPLPDLSAASATIVKKMKEFGE